MTANDLILKLRGIIDNLASGSIPLVCNNVECDIDVELKQDERGYYIELKPKIEGLPQDKDSLHIQETCKENEDSFTHSLEEAANEYGKREYNHAIHFWDEGMSKHKPEVLKSDFVDSFIAGAKWQREQMMEGAVEGVIIDEDMYGNKICLYKIPKGSKYKNAESVKILILKDNDTQGNA